jgi:hypothetical protein
MTGKRARPAARQLVLVDLPPVVPLINCRLCGTALFSLEELRLVCSQGHNHEVGLADYMTLYRLEHKVLI